MKISVKKETKAHAPAYWIWPTIVLYFQGLKVTKLRFTASKTHTPSFLSRYPILSYSASKHFKYFAYFGEIGPAQCVDKRFNWIRSEITAGPDRHDYILNT